MTTHGQIVFRGTLDKGRRVCDSLKERFSDHLVVESVAETQGGLTSRPVLRQDPLIEFVISVAEHAVALGVFETIKEFVTAAAERDGLVILKITPPDGEQEGDDT